MTYRFIKALRQFYLQGDIAMTYRLCRHLSLNIGSTIIYVYFISILCANCNDLLP